MTILYLQVQ
jgi:IPMI_arch: 3-isopropylmalate dehydratase, large subunit